VVVGFIVVEVVDEDVVVVGFIVVEVVDEDVVVVGFIVVEVVDEDVVVVDVEVVLVDVDVEVVVVGAVVVVEVVVDVVVVGGIVVVVVVVVVGTVVEVVDVDVDVLVVLDVDVDVEVVDVEVEVVVVVVAVGVSGYTSVRNAWSPVGPVLLEEIFSWQLVQSGNPLSDGGSFKPMQLNTPVGCSPFTGSNSFGPGAVNVAVPNESVITGGFDAPLSQSIVGSQLGSVCGTPSQTSAYTFVLGA